MPAVKAGIREDDRVVAMDGKPLGSIQAMIDRLQETKDKPVDVTVLRGDQTLSFHLQPVYSKTDDPTASAIALGFLNKEDTVSLGCLPGSAHALAERKQEILFPASGLAKKLWKEKFRRAWSSGPIGSPRSRLCGAAKGWTPLLALTSGISLNLGIFNLLPIPYSTAGVIFFLLIESLMGTTSACASRNASIKLHLSSWCCSPLW